jgi:hypothetical protein
MIMAERIARVKFKREPGYLYFVKSDEEGWLCIYRAIMKRGGTKKEKVKEEIKEVKEEEDI